MEIDGLLPQILHRNNTLRVQEKDLAEEVLDHLLEAGRLSPSVKNRQPWRFIAITEMQKKLALQQACYGDERCKNGALIAVCCASSDYKMPNDFSANLFDLGVASGQIMLQAEKEGLAAEALTAFSQSAASHVLTLPHSMYIATLILVGYPEQVERCDMRRSRLPKERTVNYNSW